MSQICKCMRSAAAKINHFAARNVVFVFFLSLAFTSHSSSQSFRILFAFNGTNGTSPNGPLVQGLDGSLYGATSRGGVYNQGTVFKITTSGALTTLYSFCAVSTCPDGNFPDAGLLLGTDGNFYGTTLSGGTTQSGTAFKITPQGQLTTIYSFCPTARNPCPAGYGVKNPLIQGSDGNLYGTDLYGGGAQSGAAFKMTTAGAVTVLHHFCSEANCDDGGEPNGLMQASDGNLYGTASYGSRTTNSGLVFRLTTAGKLTVLDYFICSSSDCPYGYDPLAGLVQGTNGDLYGTTSESAVYSLTLNGALSPVYSGNNFGSAQGPVIQGTDGDLYGTTVNGGTLNGGILYKVTTSGSLNVLHNFPGWRRDFPGVVQATDGNFYGTTFDSSTGNYGSIFKETMGLAPFVKSLPTSGAIGSSVIILGTNLTGATAVSFNGTAAKFSVVSATEIKATVPTGATTGTVTVTTPRGTLSSNVAFAVP